MEDNGWNPKKYIYKRPNLMLRQKIINDVRSYFFAENFLEVETPSIQITPGFDRHIRPMCLNIDGIFDNNNLIRFLHTSPELSMKKILALGEKRIFQICKAYRNGEVSKLHQPEFTMLEWYIAESNYLLLFKMLPDLIEFCGSKAKIEFLRFGDYSKKITDKWERISVIEAFREFANIELDGLIDGTTNPGANDFKEIAVKNGIRCSKNDQWSDVFHRVMLQCIEPSLRDIGFVFLYDYPLPVGALAKNKSSDNKICERVEAYIFGIELANGATELNKLVEYNSRIKIKVNNNNSELYYNDFIDYDFLESIKFMPNACGMALGIDRLIMLMTGSSEISDVLWFPINTQK